MDPQNPTPPEPNQRPDFIPPAPVRRDFMFQPAPRPPQPPQVPIQPIQPVEPPQPVQPQPQPPAQPVFPAPSIPSQPVAPIFAQPQPSLPQPAPPQPYQGQPFRPTPATQPAGESNKEYIPAVLLSWLLGYLGVDRFYLGYTATGILKLLTGGGLGVWSLLDLGRIIYGKLKDKQGRTLKGYEEHSRIFKKVFWIVLAIQLLVVPLILVALVISTFSGVQVKARDSERMADIQALHTQAQVYFEAKKSYPTLDQMNDPAFRSTNGIDGELLKDPKGTFVTLAATPIFGQQYSYEPTPANCDGVKIRCSGYRLQAILENGRQVFSKTNLTY